MRTIVRQQHGFTLIEVLMTVVIIGILASVALRSVQNGIDSSRIRATQDEMGQLAFAIAGNPDLYANGMRSDFGYIGDVGSLPTTLDNLVTNPGGYGTWNGPYISRKFTQDTDGFKQDAWGSTYAFSNGITITSSGSATTMTKSVAAAAADLTTTSIVGTVTDAVGNPPGDSSVAVSVVVTFPDGVGGTTSSSVNPSSGGSFTISSIPIGIQRVDVVYRATDDTVTAYASVLPKSGSTLSLRLPGSPFAGDGGGGSSIKYVSSSINFTDTNGNHFEFDIINTSGSDITITSLTVTYSPSVYYKKIKWETVDVFSEVSPRAGSGDTAPFSSSKTINAGATAEIDLKNWQDAPTGGNLTDVSNTDFTITFSDGSVITFNSGPI